MRRLVFVLLVVLIAWAPSSAGAQTGGPVPSQSVGDSYDFGMHPVLAVVAGAVAGVVLASTVAGSLIAGSMMWEGAGVAESLEAGTGLRVPLIGATAVLGGFAGHFLFSR